MTKLPLLAVVLIATAFFVTPAKAQRCTTANQFTSAVFELYPTARIYEHFTGSGATDFIREYNALPPATNYVGNGVVLYHRAGSLLFLLAIFSDDCLVKVAELPIPVADDLLNAPNTPDPEA